MTELKTIKDSVSEDVVVRSRLSLFGGALARCSSCLMSCPSRCHRLRWYQASLTKTIQRVTDEANAQIAEVLAAKEKDVLTS